MWFKCWIDKVSKNSKLWHHHELKYGRILNSPAVLPSGPSHTLIYNSFRNLFKAPSVCYRKLSLVLLWFGFRKFHSKIKLLQEGIVRSDLWNLKSWLKLLRSSQHPSWGSVHMYASCRSGVLLCLSFFSVFSTFGKAFFLVYPFMIPEKVGLTRSGWTSIKSNST